MSLVRSAGRSRVGKALHGPWMARQMERVWRTG